MQFTKLPTKTFVYIRPQFSCWYLHLPKNSTHLHAKYQFHFHFLKSKIQMMKGVSYQTFDSNLVVGVHLHVNFLLISASSNFVKALKIVNKTYEPILFSRLIWNWFYYNRNRGKKRKITFRTILTYFQERWRLFLCSLPNFLGWILEYFLSKSHEPCLKLELWCQPQKKWRKKWHRIFQKW